MSGYLCNILWAQMPVNSRFRPDSTLGDSSRNLEDITRLMLFSNPRKIRSQGWSENDSFKLEPASLRFWDEADTLSGFVQTLGNMGKPVRRVQYGLTDALLDPTAIQDEFTQQQDPYFLRDFSKLRYADTRTPFVNVNFAQASKRLQRVEVCISQNVTPWWNALINYNRRLSDGSFFNSATDHYNIYTTQSIRSRNGKYMLNLAGVFQQLQDGINGGIGVEKAGDSLEINPLNTDPLINPSMLRRSGKSIYLHQVYKFRSDTSRVKIHPNVFMEAERSGHFRQYEDRAFRLGNSAYPQFLKDSSQMNESWYSTIQRFRFGTGVRVGALYQEISYAYNLVENRTGYGQVFSYSHQDWKYTGEYSGNSNQSKLEWKVMHRNSSGFPTALWGEVSGVVPISGIVQRLKQDTLLEPGVERIINDWRPLRIIGVGKIGEVNSPFMELEYQGNTFSASGITQNQEVKHFRLGLEWRRADKLVGAGERYKGNYVRILGFYSGVNQFVGYTPLMQRIQDSTGNYWNRAGMEAAFRLRFKRLYFEPEVVYQPFGNSSNGMEIYLFEQPDFYSKASFYYENQLFKKAGLFRFGIDFWGFSDFYGLGFEPGSGLFIPAGQSLTATSGDQVFFSYLIPSYYRADVFLTAKVRSAVIFLRLMHVNQGMQYPQYYTTPYYPSWGRVFSFGVNWTFWD